MSSWCRPLVLACALATCVAAFAHAATITRTPIALELDGRRYQLDLYATAGAEIEKRPGLVLVPEYWGKDQLEVEPAQNLAKRGYIVLVLDFYGGGLNAKTTEGADQLVESAEARGIDRVVAVIDRAIEHLKHHEGVDRERIGAVGFGYGGGLIYDLAKRGNSGLSAAVSFYGGTKKLRETSAIGRLPELLYIRPERDTYTSPEELSAFRAELGKSGFRYEIFPVTGAYYGFIHKDIELYGGDDGNTFMYFDREKSSVAWERAYGFLDKNLKPREK